jgi:PadR family transcriptional regulator, regulatory protein AphA
MDIKYAILGFLSWQPCTGYDLKKMVVSSSVFYWSGNNNQIYTTLVTLHKAGLVTDRIEPQERYPSRKVYTITGVGLAELRGWMLSVPELPQYRSMFLVQLAWADALSESELNSLLAKYEDEISTQLMMLREREKRGINLNPARTPREKYIWDMIDSNNSGRYEYELDWVRRLRRGLSNPKYTRIINTGEI